MPPPQPASQGETRNRRVVQEEILMKTTSKFTVRAAGPYRLWAEAPAGHQITIMWDGGSGVASAHCRLPAYLVPPNGLW
jgi:hypothetical protein